MKTITLTNWKRIVPQIAFWICLITAMNLMFFGTAVPPDVYYRYYFHVLTAVFLILLNINYFVPQYFHTKRYGPYVLITGFCVFAFMAMAYFVESSLQPVFERPFPMDEGPPRHQPRPRQHNGFFDPKRFTDFLIYMAIILASTVLESIQWHRKQEKLAIRIKNEKLETEMKFLKSQINPHFLFNVLNNVYTLSLIKSDQTPEVVMKLSEMLRYVLYETNHAKVSLDQEIKYIENYIALQQLKDDVPLSVETTFDVLNKKTEIAPMVFIPFVENAFKHSKIEDTKNGWIKIMLNESRDAIVFRVVNSFPETDFSKDPTGGIGLKNVQRRLELEYPKKHRLDIQGKEQQFSVNLIIDL